jgi:hypothetical protein
MKRGFSDNCHQHLHQQRNFPAGLFTWLSYVENLQNYQQFFKASKLINFASK